MTFGVDLTTETQRTRSFLKVFLCALSVSVVSKLDSS